MCVIEKKEKNDHEYIIFKLFKNTSEKKPTFLPSLFTVGNLKNIVLKSELLPVAAKTVIGGGGKP